MNALRLLLASGLAAGADAAYRPVPAGLFQGQVRLWTDPEPAMFSWTAEVVDSSGRHLLLDGSGSAGDRLSHRQAGEQVLVEMTVDRFSGKTWDVKSTSSGVRLAAYRAVATRDAERCVAALLVHEGEFDPDPRIRALAADAPR